jgi:hypothetical protein
VLRNREKFKIAIAYICLNRGQRAEGRRQKYEGRGQRAKGKRQKAKGKRQKAKGKRKQPLLFLTCYLLLATCYFPYSLLPTRNTLTTSFVSYCFLVIGFYCQGAIESSDRFSKILRATKIYTLIKQSCSFLRICNFFFC